MSKNPSERKGMPGQSEELNRDTQQGQRRDTQQGQHKEGQKGMGAPDWKKEKEQQQPHRQGQPVGQQPKQTDPNKRQPGGSDTEEIDERKRRQA
jgi:hypothetical protein